MLGTAIELELAVKNGGVGTRKRCARGCPALFALRMHGPARLGR